MNFMLSTVNLDQQIKLQQLLDVKAPKRKQAVLVPKHKRTKKRPKSASSEEVGTKIEPTHNYIPGLPPINKTEWKYFKPWLDETTPLPEWA